MRSPLPAGSGTTRSASTPWLGIAAIAFAGLVFDWTPAAERIDLFVLDQAFGVLRAAGPKPAPDDIVIVGIDEASERAIGEPLAMWHVPLGKVLAKIASAKPRAIGLGVTLPERSFDSIRPGLDRALLEGLAAARSVDAFVVALGVGASREAKPIHTPFLAIVDDKRMGLAIVGRDVDGVTRRYSLAIPTEDGAFPTFVGRLCSRLAADCRAGITDYGLGPAYRYVPLARVLEMNDPKGLERLFGDRIVLVGETQRFTDRIAQPLNLAGWEAGGGRDAPGVLAHAQALRTALHGRPVLAAHPAGIVIVLSAAALLLAIRDWRLAFVTGLLSGAGVLAGATWILREGVQVPVAAPLFALVLAVVSRGALAALRHRRERDRLRYAFAGRVNPAVLDGILAGDIETGHRAEKRDLAFLFADLRGFTALADKSTPASVIQLVNRFHDVAAAAVHRHDGFLEDIRGDGVLAVFGAPKFSGNPAGAAFSAAEDLLRGLDRLNAQRATRGEEALTTAIGLAAGDASVGRIGPRDRFTFAAVADAASVAIRLSDEARRVRYRVVMTAPVRDEAGVAQLDSLGAVGTGGHEPVAAWGWAGP